MFLPKDVWVLAVDTHMIIEASVVNCGLRLKPDFGLRLIQIFGPVFGPPVLCLISRSSSFD